MTTQQITRRLQDILANIGTNTASVHDDTNFSRDLGLDSLDITDLLLQVETQFMVRIPDQDWWKLQTMGQLKAYLVQDLTLGNDQPTALAVS